MNSVDAPVADAALTREEAERLCTRISLRLDTVVDGWNGTLALIRDAIAGDAYVALGYRSHGDMIADRFGGSLSKLGIELRREVVRELTNVGISQRALAPVFNVSQSTIRDDVSSTYSPDAHLNDKPVGVSTSPEVVEPASPVEESNAVAAASPVEGVTGAVEDAPAPVTINPATGEVVDVPTVTEHTVTEKTRTVTGLDGKTYETPAGPKQRRSSIVDTARNAGWQLRKAIERLDRIKQDDRFTRNKAEIVAALQPHLDLARGVLDDL